MIRHRRRHRQDIRLGLGGSEGRLHLGGCLHRGAGQPLQQGGIQRQWAMHQLHRGTPQTGSLGQQHPHQTGTAIAEKAGWIQGFAGWPRTHQQPQSLPIPLPPPEGQGFQGKQHKLRFRHPPGAQAVTGQ